MSNKRQQQAQEVKEAAAEYHMDAKFQALLQMKKRRDERYLALTSKFRPGKKWLQS